MGMVIKGEYNEHRPQLDTDGQYANLRVDEDGKLIVNAGENLTINATIDPVVVVTGGEDQEDPVEVEGTVTLGAGNATIGKLAANSGVDIGDVDVTSVPAPLSVVGNGAAATAQRVTLANDSTGIVQLAAGTNGIGRLTANSGVDIGDVDVTSVTPGTGATALGKAEDAAHASGDVGVMALAVRNDAGSVFASTDGDYIPLTTDASGSLRVVSDSVVKTRVSKRVTLAASQTLEPIWTPDEGKKFVLVKVIISCHTAGVIRLLDDADDKPISPQFKLGNSSGWSETWYIDFPFRSEAVDNVMCYTTDSGFTGSIYVEGWEE